MGNSMESKEHLVQSKYLRTVISSKLVKEFESPSCCAGDRWRDKTDLHVKTTASMNSGWSITRINSDDDDAQREQDRVMRQAVLHQLPTKRVYVFGGKERITFCTWLSPMEFEYLQQPGNETLLLAWLEALDFEPTEHLEMDDRQPSAAVTDADRS